MLPGHSRNGAIVVPTLPVLCRRSSDNPAIIQAGQTVTVDPRTRFAGQRTMEKPRSCLTYHGSDQLKLTSTFTTFIWGRQ